MQFEVIPRTNSEDLTCQRKLNDVITPHSVLFGLTEHDVSWHGRVERFLFKYWAVVVHVTHGYLEQVWKVALLSQNRKKFVHFREAHQSGDALF